MYLKHICAITLFYHPGTVFTIQLYQIQGWVSMAIDYSDIGQRIRHKRMEKRLTQEKLAEMVGIGPSHMSHLESGKTVASMDVFIAICNVLECSADELLCREIITAKPILDNWLAELIADCDAVETKILTDILISAKSTLRKHKVED